MDNYALSSTNTIINTSPPLPDLPPLPELVLLWCAASGASFTMLIALMTSSSPSPSQTVVLINPISNFDSLLHVYFVPESVVKHISLGSLSTLDYTYASGLSRSLTIRTPAGRVLCTCPFNLTAYGSFQFTSCQLPKLLTIPTLQLHTPLNPIHL